MGYYDRERPSFATAFFAVYVAGAITALGSNALLSSVLAVQDHRRKSTPSLALLASAEVLSLVISSAVAALVVWGVLSFEGAAPTYRRTFVAMLAGNVASVATVIILATQAARTLPSPGSTNALLPLAWTARSLLLAPFAWLGLLLSVWIICGAREPLQRARASKAEQWEYKLPPGASWRE
jgi:hypothetical protein